MLRQASSRNQRNKGFKLKHALQLFVLLAISIWLLYQVKHSYDKKMAFEKNDLKNSNRLNDYVPSISKLGRKDLYHKNGLTITKEDHQEDEVEEEEETRQEDENFGEKRGDEEPEESDQEKEDEEVERAEDFGEEEENERRELDGEADLFKKQDYHDEIDMDSQEAQDEQYNPDDASNSILSDTQLLKSELDNIHSEELKIDVSIKNSSIDENLSNKTEDTSSITMKNSYFDKLADEQVVRTERNNDIGEKIENESLEDSIVWNEEKRMEKLGQDQVESNENNRTEDVNMEKIIHERMNTLEVKEKEIAPSSPKPHPNFIGVSKKEIAATGKIERDDFPHKSINLTKSHAIHPDVSYQRVNGNRQIETLLGSEINDQHKLTIKYPTKQNGSVPLAENESLVYSITHNKTVPIESSQDQRDHNVMVELNAAKSLWINRTEESWNSSIAINPEKEEKDTVSTS